jgi:trans-aconitate 2-methyltransferase
MLPHKHMADWDPDLYNRFRRYRAEPFEAILARLQLGAAERIIDLGCGTGENTVELARRTAKGSVLGIDSSRAMIEHALALRAGLDESLRAKVDFALEDIRNLRADREYTVVFSNAALQWLSGHRDVFAACYRALRPGGTLVVQVPANEHETAQATIAALASEPEWITATSGAQVPSLNVDTPDHYRVMLGEIGFNEIDCYYHTFHHPMQSPAEVIEWSRATVLRPFLDRLPSDRRDTFIAELNRRLVIGYGTRGALTLDYRRLFLWARRPAD